MRQLGYGYSPIARSTLPTGTVAVRAFATGSISTTVPGPSLTAQTAPSPAATATGFGPATICADGVRAAVGRKAAEAALADRDARDEIRVARVHTHERRLAAAHDPDGAKAGGDPDRRRRQRDR